MAEGRRGKEAEGRRDKEAERSRDKKAEKLNIDRLRGGKRQG